LVPAAIAVIIIDLGECFFVVAEDKILFHHRHPLGIAGASGQEEDERGGKKDKFNCVRKNSHYW